MGACSEVQMHYSRVRLSTGSSGRTCASTLSHSLWIDRCQGKGAREEKGGGAAGAQLHNMIDMGRSVISEWWRTIATGLLCDAGQTHTVSNDQRCW